MNKSKKKIACLLLSSIFVVVGVLLLGRLNLLSGNKFHHGKALDWEKYFDEFGLSKEDSLALKNDGLLITNKTIPQVFSCYVGNRGGRYFITSDAVLSAYHFLYDQTFIEYESQRALQLEGFLLDALEDVKVCQDRFKGNDQLVINGKMKATIILGVAVKLMNSSYENSNSAIDSVISYEAENIQRGGLYKNSFSWLKDSQPSVGQWDYDKYKPTGFYKRTNPLSQYFQALTWLESIPFDLDHDDELISALMVSCGLSMNHEYFVDHYYSSENESRFMNQVVDTFPGTEQLSLDETGLIELRKRVFINWRDTENKISNVFNLPLIFNTRNRPVDVESEDFKGLAIPVALGSDFASGELDSTDVDIVQIKQKLLTHQSSYQKVLSSLCQSSESCSPDFLQNKAWEIKSCNTVLASLAQKETLPVLFEVKNETTPIEDGDLRTSGFVEPNPSFFREMSSLLKESHSFFKSRISLEEKSNYMYYNIQNYLDIMKQYDNFDDFDFAIRSLPPQEMKYLNTPYMLQFIDGMRGPPKKEYSEMIIRYEELLEDYKDGTLDNGQYKKIASHFRDLDFDLERSWIKLEYTCKDLARIAEKQLNQEDFTVYDNDCINEFGRLIAEIMLYKDGDHLYPEDDAYEIVGVFLSQDSKKYKYIGISRPRIMYVLYPWKGQVYLCHGAILPYYEFESSERISKDGWKILLDSDKRPSIPSWISNIVSGGDLPKPDKLLD